MKKNYFLALLVQIPALSVLGQISVNQLIVGNGGVYGNSADHVTLTGINPENYNSTFIGEIWRESVQDLIVVGDVAYVAAEDSLVKFDMDTQERLSAVYQGNLKRLHFANQTLYVSLRSDLNGPPADGVYLKAFDENLNLIHQTTGISTDASGIAIAGDSIYVAVPGDWMATEGHLAVVSTDFSVTHEINLGTEAVGILDLYLYNQAIYSVNKSPYLATTGSVTNYQITNGNFSTIVFNHVVGKGAGRIGNLIYLGLDYGLGSFNIETQTIENQSIIADPGTSNYIYIAAALVDEINSQIYITTTDYFSFGAGKVYGLNGSELGVFDAEVSAEALALHLKDETAVNNISAINHQIYPNPCNDFFRISGVEKPVTVEIFNRNGQLITSYSPQDEMVFPISNLSSGTYFIKITNSEYTEIQKLIKL